MGNPFRTRRHVSNVSHQTPMLAWPMLLVLVTTTIAPGAVDPACCSAAAEPAPLIRTRSPAPTDDAAPDVVATHVGGIAARLRDHTTGESLPGELFLLMGAVGATAMARVYDETPYIHDRPEHADRAASNAAAVALANDLTGSDLDARQLTSAPNGGPSGGLLLTLAYLNESTDGRFTGPLRVGATGELLTEGYLGPIKAINEKIGAAKAADLDVVFTTSLPSHLQLDRHVARHAGQRHHRRDGVTPLGVERGFAHYEQWGSTRPDGLDVIVVGHIGDATAYLCGTGSSTACDLARRLATTQTSDPHHDRRTELARLRLLPAGDVVEPNDGTPN